jgi:hypothetical protein
MNSLAGVWVPTSDDTLNMINMKFTTPFSVRFKCSLGVTSQRSRLNLFESKSPFGGRNRYVVTFLLEGLDSHDTVLPFSPGMVCRFGCPWWTHSGSNPVTSFLSKTVF